MKIKDYEAEVITKNEKPVSVKIKLPFKYHNADSITCAVKDNCYFEVLDFEALKAGATMLEAEFYLRPGDAIQYVKDGYADALKLRENTVSNIFNKVMDLIPVKLLDEKKGEKIRQKTIKEFERFTYKYTIYKIDKDSVYGLEIYLRSDYKDLKCEVDDRSDMCFASCYFVDNKGRVKDFDLPEADIFMTDNKEEAESLIPEIKKYVCDDSHKYIYGVRQYLIS